MKNSLPTTVLTAAGVPPAAVEWMSEVRNSVCKRPLNFAFGYCTCACARAAPGRHASSAAAAAYRETRAVTVIYVRVTAWRLTPAPGNGRAPNLSRLRRANITLWSRTRNDARPRGASAFASAEDEQPKARQR